MPTTNVKLIFDRRKQAEKTGKGKVEVEIYLEKRVRRYINVKEITAKAWPSAQKSKEMKAILDKYTKIRNAMELLDEPLTLETLNKHLGIVTRAEAKRRAKAKEEEDFSILSFIRETMAKEKVSEGTMKMKRVVLRLVEEFGNIQKIADLDPKRIAEFDDWLHAKPELSDVTIYGYHKIFRFYVRKLIQIGKLSQNPYDVYKVKRGRYKERTPLTEDELLLMRKLRLPLKEAKVRDLFIFSAYTGLAYCDAQAFNFKTMTEKHGDMYFIDGGRIKTGTKFFTPILPPAMEVLERYNYQLPRISNQKMNDYLHLIESRMCLNKELTCHVARHSFATLSLSHDVPIEKVARMLGHTDIRTTQVYAKILKDTIERHAFNLASSIR